MLRRYYKLFVKKSDRVTSNRRLERKRLCWNLLFGGNTPDEIIKKINDIWLDPRYMIFLKK
jgi:hypothetical protein